MNKYLEKIAEIYEDKTGHRPRRKEGAHKRKESHDWSPAVMTGASDMASGVTTGLIGGAIADKYFKGKYSVPITSGIGAAAAAALADKIQRDRETR